MELWAQGELGGRVDFLCICVESLEVAQMFGEMFRFRHVTNGWIADHKYGPRYGQLGCSGFVVLDGDGNFLSRKTAAFLQYDVAAFQDLVRVVRRGLLLSEGADKDTSPLLHASYPYRIGAKVTIDGLKSNPEMNGQEATVLGFQTATGRFQVRLQSGRAVAIRPCSLAPVNDADNNDGDVGAEGAREEGEGKEPKNKQQRCAAVVVEDKCKCGATPEEGVLDVKAPESVGVSSMDHEHDACWNALQTLRTDSTVASLEALRAEMSAHFTHEEALMETSGFGGDGGAFSARTGHVKDHKRILEEIDEALNKAKAGEKQKLRPEVYSQMATTFVKHVEAFDKLYEGMVADGA